MLSRKQVIKIQKLDNEGFSSSQIAKDLKISSKTVNSYLKNPQLSTQPQNLNNGEHASIDDDEIVDLQKDLKIKQIKRKISTVPLEKPDVVMASSLRRKFESLGIVDHEDIHNNLKSLYPLLNKTERYMLKVYSNKCVARSNQLVKESREELIEVGKTELDRLYDEVESGKITEDEYEYQTEDLLTQIEAEVNTT